jgi:uncharacterized protein YneF (UPF0154 family)
MITVSPKSWHYKLYKKFSKTEPTNLCGYFWTIFLGCLWTIWTIFLGCLWTIWAVFGFGVILVTIIKHLIDFDWLWMLQAVGMIIGIGVSLLIGAVIAIWIVDLILEKTTWFDKNPDKAPGFIKLTAELIKAKKNRICPVIQVKG